MINSFQDWKDTCQKEFNWLAVHLRSLTETGKARLRMCGAFLDIADWSDSATEAVEWIDGKYEMDPEIRVAIDTPMAEQLIADIRRLAKEEQERRERETRKMKVVKCAACGQVLKGNEHIYAVRTFRLLDGFNPHEVVVPACCGSCAAVVRKQNWAFWTKIRNSLNDALKTIAEQPNEHTTVERFLS